MHVRKQHRPGICYAPPDTEVGYGPTRLVLRSGMALQFCFCLDLVGVGNFEYSLGPGTKLGYPPTSRILGRTAADLPVLTAIA
eukprot:3523067-Rhodomonas_salina.6